MRFGLHTSRYALYAISAKPVQVKRARFWPRMRRMRFRRKLGRYWPYVILACLCLSVFFTFVVLIKTMKLGERTSSVGKYLNDQGENGGVVAGFLFGGDDEPLLSKDPFERELGGKSRMPPSVENMEETPKSHTGETLLNYFMTMYMDGIEIAWGMEVNTEDTLLEAMKDFLIMMLEADVDLKPSTHDKDTKTPVLISSESNPVDQSHDMLMVDWMTRVSTYSNKGMKLNFKDEETLHVALMVMHTLKETLHAPIWIHADVLAGPNSQKVTVDAQKLIEAIDEFPRVTVSLGWSTEWDPDGHQNSYTWQEAISMAKICAPIRQHVSFSVRAVFAVRSMRPLKWLLSLTNRFSITVWANKYDIIAVPELEHFRQSMDAKKVYYNLPPNIVEGLRKVSSKPEKDIDKIVIAKWDRTIWQPMLLQSTSLAFMGTEQVVLDGPGSWLVSRIPYQPELQRTRTTVVSGKIQFLRPISLITVETKFQIFIRSSGVNPPPESKVQGVRLTITDDGTLELSAENLHRAGAYGMKSSAKLPQVDCYTFRLVDKGDGFPVFCEVRSAPCDGEEAKASPSVELHLRVPYDNQGQLFYVSLTVNGGKDPVIIEDLTVT